MCARTFPVAGLMEGNVSIEMAVAAITGILTDFPVVVAATADVGAALAFAWSVPRLSISLQ